MEPEEIPTPGPGERYKLRIDAIPVSEEWIDDAIRRAGGIRLADVHTFPEGMENCDYLLGGNLLIELKILEKDSFETPERQAKLAGFFTELGITAEAGVEEIGSNQLKPEDRARFYDIVYGNIPGLIRKAERQISSTAKFLGLKEHTGVILLVNKECETLDPEPLRRYAADMIRRKKCESLRYAVLFSCLAAASKPGNPSTIGLIVGDEGDDAFHEPIWKVGEALRAKVGEALGREIHHAPDDIGPLTNLRDDRRFTYGDLTVTLKSQTRPLIEANLAKMKPRPPE